MAKQNSAEFQTNFELVSDGVRLVSFGVGLSVYVNGALSRNGREVLTVYDRFLDLAPKSDLVFYATENMRRHKPVTKATLSMLPTWLSSGASQRDFVNLQLKDGRAYQDAARLKFDIFGVEPKSKLFNTGLANVISLRFPVTHEVAAAARLRKLFIELCSILPFRSAQAGYSLECSNYNAETSQTHAWNIAMLHPGVDIARIDDDAIAVGQDAIKGVGWLTALDQKFVSQIGGRAQLRKALPADVDFIDVQGGLILQAGTEPAVGDVNTRDTLPLYRAIFKPLASLVTVAAKRSPSFNLATDYVERTERWFTRLGDG